MRRSPRAIVMGFVLAAGGAAAAMASSQDDAVLAGYRTYYAGDKEAAQRHFERLVASNPSALPARLGLLQVLESRSSDDRSLEADFERLMEAFLRDAEGRYARSATDDEALFSLENAYLLRATYRLDHDKGVWSAARDGARSKRLGEAYIKRHPEHGDAYFALGTYNYYVEIAPAFLKVVRLFLFLPPGNRVEGLQQIERAYTRGNLLSFPAGLVLMEVYGSLENRVADAVRIGSRLAREYPDNPAVQLQLAELFLSPAVEDPVRAEEQYRGVIAREERRGRGRPEKYQAQLGLSAALQQQWRLDEALRLVSSTIDAKPQTPEWVMPAFLLRRANYRALVGDAGAADDARRVLAEPRWKEQHRRAQDLLKWMERWRGSGEAAGYVALLGANRLAAEHRWDDAAAAYEAVRRDHPDDPQVRYRIAVVQFARGETDRAVPAFASISADQRAPAWVRAQSLLHVARAHDLAGRRAEAKATYERIVNDYEHEGAAGAARVGLVTPYQRKPL